MNHHDAPLPDPDTVLETDAKLQHLLEQMLRNANQRQVWMILLGRDHRVTGPLMPMDELPDSPDDLCDTPDLGREPFARVLLARLGMVGQMLDARAAVLVWERPGEAKFTSDDLAWARSAAAEAAEQGLPLRAQFLLHSQGLRMLVADDYA